MKTIRLIAWNTIQSLNAKKVLYVLPFLILIVAAGQWQKVYNVFYVYSDLPLFIEQVWLISGTLYLWHRLTVITAIIFASGIISGETKHKTILGILAKPVARWEFLLGKWGGLHMFFCVIYAVGIAIVLLAMIYWEIPISGLFGLGVVNNMLLLVAFSTIAFVLSMHMPRALGGGIAFSLFYFQYDILSLMKSSDTAEQILGSVLYYVSPAYSYMHLVWEGSLETSLHPEVGFMWGLAGANVVYGGLLLLIAALLYQNRDIPLGSE